MHIVIIGNKARRGEWWQIDYLSKPLNPRPAPLLTAVDTTGLNLSLLFVLASSSSLALLGVDEEEDDSDSDSDDDEFEQAARVVWARISEAAASGNVINLHLLQTENFPLHRHHHYHDRHCQYIMTMKGMPFLH